MITTLFLFLIAVIIITSTWLNNLSSKIGVPTLLAFILLGMLIGNIRAIPIYMDNHDTAKDICSIALIFIMFYGGFGTRWKAVKPVVTEAGLLASAGVVMTAALTGLFCHYGLKWNWNESFLLGAVLGSTDAASVFSILRSKNLGLKNNTGPMLEIESGSNDPFSYMLTAVMISIIQGSASGGHIAWMLFAQLVFGAGAGVMIAKMAAYVLEHISFSTRGFDTLFIFAVAIASYAIPELIGGNGYLSAYLVGIILGNEHFKGKKSIVAFFDGLTDLMQVLIFFVIGLLATPSLLAKAVLPALAIFLFMLLAARPLAVFSLLSPFRKYPFKQKLLVSFSGLRGAASIVFAIMAVSGTAGLDNDIFNIVFCIVLISIAIQGSLIPAAAKGLDMIDTGVNVLKTFNDYSEDLPFQFGRTKIKEGDPWVGKKIKDIPLPKNFLIVLILRNGQNIRPQGETILLAGDEIVTLNESFEDTKTILVEKAVKQGSRRVGHPLSEFPGDGLVVMVFRGEHCIIPSGDTILQEGDRLLLLRDKYQSL